MTTKVRRFSLGLSKQQAGAGGGLPAPADSAVADKLPLAPARLSLQRSITAAALLLALSAWGCSRGDHASQGAAAPEVAAQKAKYLLPAEPAEATGVADARQSARDTQELTVIGRVGGAEEPIVEAAAAFLIVDEAAEPCQDGCKTPWDYCCSPQLATSKAMVKIVDEGGVPVAADARRLLGISELQTVVVRGRAKRDEAGNLTILADGVYVRR